MTGSLGSLLKTSAKAARDFDVVSSADILTAAVYNALAYVPSRPYRATGGLAS